MDKKRYLPPNAEVALFAPAENVAAQEHPWLWNWGLFSNRENASLTTTQDIWIAPWEYDSTSDPY